MTSNNKSKICLYKTREKKNNVFSVSLKPEYTEKMKYSHE